MELLPAIDIKDGSCVRLYQGDFATVHKVAEDVLETARGFEEAGARWVHMVDLDGALQGKRVNAPLFARVARETGLRVELGGGIRDMETVEFYLEQGLSRLILGSAAVNCPAFVKEAAAKYREKIAVGIDAKNGMVAAQGWTEDSKIHYLELGKRMEQLGVKTLIYTDISKDGTLSGISAGQLEELNRAVSCDVIASGGVKDIADVRAAKALGLAGIICGKAIYQGTLSLKEALAEV